ncbi:MAG: competence/damage-inducible protein A [Chloroflexota bacterium]
MRAEIICVGTELLLGQITNTDARYIARRLNTIGVDVLFESTVGDNATRLEEVLRRALDRSDLIVVSGGLGPTDDDLTKETLAAVTGRELEMDVEALATLENWFRTRGRVMTPNNRKQALMPRGGKALPNPNGTAPGVFLEHEGKLVFLLPGPPRELEPMVESAVLPELRRRGQTQVIHSRVLRFCGIGESELETRVKDIIDAQSNPTIAPLVADDGVTLRVTAKAGDIETAERLIEPVVGQLRERVGQYLFGIDDQDLAAAVGEELKRRGATVAVAESCTGGLLGGRLSAVPGCSAYFLGGIIAYDNSIKHSLLGVPAAVLRDRGAVSRETAAAMAGGVLRQTGATYAVAITGIAGPTGGDNKPVGLVYIAFAGPLGTEVEEQLIQGDRARVRNRTVSLALAGLWRRLRQD